MSRFLAPPASPGLAASVHAPASRLFAASLLGWSLAVGAAAPAPEVVSLDQARAQAESGAAILIDIREPREHATGVAAQARLLPMSQLNARVGEIPADPARPVYLICNSQNRSSAALKALRQSGPYGHVSYVQGGMSEWVKRGWPTVKPGS